MNVWFYVETYVKMLALATVTLVLLEFAGRRTVSQLSAAHFVVLIALGDMMQIALDREHTGRAITGIVAIMSFLVITDWLMLKFNWLEKRIDDCAKIVVKNGNIDEKMLKKLRYTVDRLETELRAAGIADFKDCQYVTLESNGQIGFKLKPQAAPLTYQDFETYLEQRFSELMGNLEPVSTPLPSDANLFREAEQGRNVVKISKELD